MAKLKEHLGFEIPTEYRPVFAKICLVEDLALSEWFEVIYYGPDGWTGYYGGTSFDEGEKVVAWVYADEILTSRPLVAD